MTPSALAQLDPSPTPDDRVCDLFFSEVKDYPGLVGAVRERIEKLNISRLCVDEVAGLTPGHAAKLLSQGEAKDVKRFGISSLGRCYRPLA